MKKCIIAVVFAALAPFVHAQCVPQLQIQPNSRIDINVCPDTPKIAVGDNFTIDTGNGVPLAVSATRVVDAGILGTNVETNPLDPGSTVITTINQSQSVKLIINGQTVAANVKSAVSAQNYNRYTWSLGPASQGDTSTTTTTPAGGTDDPNGAIRLRYDGEYARGGFFGYTKNPLWQTNASLSIDTTDQESTKYIDTNRATVGLRFTNLSFGRVWMHGKAGADVRYERGVHNPAKNTDVVFTVSGWVPVLRSFTLFSSEGEFIAAPLTFNASYGYRQHSQDNTTSQNGRVFEAIANYNLYLFDQYQLTLNGTLTHNDYDHPVAGVPRTQRMYKAQIAYLANPRTGFSVVTSFENGSAGVMLHDVRQYFIGIALGRLNLGGSSSK